MPSPPYFHQPIRSRKTWRSSFYVLTGLAFIILLSGLYSIDADLPSQETDKRVDWIGALLVTTGLVLIVFVLGQGEIAPLQWATPCNAFNSKSLRLKIILTYCLDIIALLVVGFIFMSLFVCWQYYLEKRFDNSNSIYSVFMPPPIMRISLWTRANGRLAAVMIIGFTTWCGFASFSYWIQVWGCIVYIQFDRYSSLLTLILWVALLSKLQAIYTHAKCRPCPAHACLRPNMQCLYWVDGSVYTACLACRSVY